jgi:hypothetical protein
MGTEPTVQHHDLAAVVGEHEPMLALVCAEPLHEHVVTRLWDTPRESGGAHRPRTPGDHMPVYVLHDEDTPQQLAGGRS